jgi:CPA1 family monovalent cation:H+ antiporter
MIGMQVLLVAVSVHTLVAAAIAAAVTLLARALTVGLPVSLLPGAFKLPAGSGWVLTWGGLRGGISVALALALAQALSLPAGPGHDTLIALTYCVVVFSILAQGLGIGHVVRQTARGRG